MLTYTRFDITNLELPFEREYTFEEGTFIFMVYENRVSYDIIIQILNTNREILHVNKLVYGRNAIDTPFTNIPTKIVPYDITNEREGKPPIKVTRENLGKGVDLISSATIS